MAISKQQLLHAILYATAFPASAQDTDQHPVPSHTLSDTRQIVGPNVAIGIMSMSLGVLQLS